MLTFYHGRHILTGALKVVTHSSVWGRLIELPAATKWGLHPLWVEMNCNLFRPCCSQETKWVCEREREKEKDRAGLLGGVSFQEVLLKANEGALVSTFWRQRWATKPPGQTAKGLHNLPVKKARAALSEPSCTPSLCADQWDKNLFFLSISMFNFKRFRGRWLVLLQKVGTQNGDGKWWCQKFFLWFLFWTCLLHLIEKQWMGPTGNVGKREGKEDTQQRSPA